MPTALTEDQLIALYRAHLTPLYAYVSRRVGGDRALAEDIVQEAWLRAVATWPDRGTPDVPLAWLIRTARNLLVSHFRQRRPLPVDPAELDLTADPFNPDSRSAVELVNWGLARLRPKQAVLLEAFYLEGKSTREIASEAGVSERAVEGRLRRARQSLEKRLQPYLEGGPPRSASSAVRGGSSPIPEGRRNNV